MNQNSLSYAAQLIFGLVLGTIPSLSTAEQVKKDHLCFELWQDQVAEVNSAFSEGFPSNKVVYFVGRDGRTFDCLNMNAPEPIQVEFEHWSRQIAPLAEKTAREEGSTSVNFCNLSRQKIGLFQIVGIHLPYERETLSSLKCQIRLRNLPSRIREDFQ